MAIESIVVCDVCGLPIMGESATTSVQLSVIGKHCEHVFNASVGSETVNDICSDCVILALSMAAAYIQPTMRIKS